MAVDARGVACEGVKAAELEALLLVHGGGGRLAEVPGIDLGACESERESERERVRERVGVCVRESE